MNTDTLLREWFDKGDYARVAATAGSMDWRFFAARGIIGRFEQGLSGLCDFTEPEARFYRAVILWIAGRDEEAIRQLEIVETEHAQNLLKLARKPRIHVLAQLPWHAGAPTDILSGAHADPRFCVRNIVFETNDTPNVPYANVHSLYDEKPDFYVCQMVEWHLIPPNIQELNCPLIGETSDYDIHIQAIHPWLQVFDELVVASSSEWDGAHGLVKCPVSSFPKSFGVTGQRGPRKRVGRDIDFFLSGTVLNPYHPDKAALYHAIQRAAEISPLFINGFVENYDRMAASTNLGVTYIRYPRGMPTRALEMLSHGCPTIVQGGCALELYVSEQEGLLQYQSVGKDLIDQIRRVLNNPTEWQHRAARGADVIVRDFAFETVFSQFMRFLTFLAARPRGPRRIVPRATLKQKRVMLWKGWFPGGSETMRQCLEANVEAFENILGARTTVESLIDIGREYLLAKLGGIGPADAHTRAIEAFDNARSLEPHALVAEFDCIRALFHLADPERAVVLANDAIRRGEDDWDIDPLHDIFPCDVWEAFFNYRSYLDLVTAHMSGLTDARPALKQLVLASLAHYVGIFCANTEMLRRAVQYDPDFPYYAFSLGRSLLHQQSPDEQMEGVRLLERLVCTSLLVMDAWELLEKHGGHFLERGADLGEYVNRCKDSTLFIESLPDRDVPPRGWRVPESGTVREREPLRSVHHLRRNAMRRVKGIVKWCLERVMGDSRIMRYLIRRRVAMGVQTGLALHDTQTIAERRAWDSATRPNRPGS